MGNGCQDVLLPQFGMCFLPTLGYNVMSMDRCASGIKMSVWLGPDLDGQMLIEPCEPPKFLACQELKETTLLMNFQASLLGPWLMQEWVFLRVLALNQNLIAPLPNDKMPSTSSCAACLPGPLRSWVQNLHVQMDAHVHIGWETEALSVVRSVNEGCIPSGQVQIPHFRLWL